MDNTIIMKPQTISKSRMWMALVAIILGQFVVSIDLTVLNIALPEITKELRPDADQLLWIVDIYSLVLAGFLVAASSLSDRIGRKAILLTGFLFFGIGSVLVLFVTEAWQLIGIRGFLGIGGAMIMPVTISMVRSIFTDAKERAFAVAAWSAVSAVGMAVGPLIGGFLLEHFEWHSAFLVNIPLVGIAFILGVFTLPEVKVKTPGPFDILGSLIALAGMTLLLWGIKHLASELEFDTPGIVAVSAGLLLMILFVLKCRYSKAPIVDLSLFRNKTFTAGVLATAICTFAMASLLYMLSQWLQLVNGDGTLEAGLKLVPMAVASLISSTGAAALAERIPARNVIAGGLVMAAGAMIMLYFFRDDLTLTPVLIATCLVGFGIGSLAIGAALIMSETPIEKASSAGSLQEISYDMGNVLGVAILGSIASIIYRNGLSTGSLTAMGLDYQIIDQMKQSFAATSEIATVLGIPELIDRGADAFNDSIVMTCLIGGIIILVTTFVVWALIPKDLKITDNAEDEPPLAQPAPAQEPIAQAAPSQMSPLTDGGSVTISLDAYTLRNMQAVCSNLGITAETAFAVFAKKVANERKIPFKLKTDPVYNERNIAHICKGIEDLDADRGVMHECDDTIKIWAPEAWEDYMRFRDQNKETSGRIRELLRDIEKNGESAGDGNPCRMNGDMSDLWIRDIDRDNKLIYRFIESTLQVISCKCCLDS